MPKGHNKAKPQVVKKLEGTYRPDRDKGSIDLPISLKGLPEAPKNLKGEGLIYYNEQGNKLLSVLLVSEYNLSLFVTICFLMSKVEYLARKMDETDNPSDIATYARLYLQFQQALRISMAEFGLTPASAGKVTMKKDDNRSDFEKNYL